MLDLTSSQLSALKLRGLHLQSFVVCPNSITLYRATVCIMYFFEPLVANCMNQIHA